LAIVKRSFLLYGEIIVVSHAERTRGRVDPSSLGLLIAKSHEQLMRTVTKAKEAVRNNGSQQAA